MHEIYPASSRNGLVVFALMVLTAHMSAQNLPKPTGSYEIGTSTTGLIDMSRKDTIKQANGRFREIMIQLWYPAASGSNPQIAAYVTDKRLMPTLVNSQYNFQPKDVIQSLSRVKTQGLLNAAISHREVRYPMLIFSPGLGEPRSNYTAFAQELASHGYIVVTVDHPYGGYTVLPDGRILTTQDDPRGGTEDGAAVVMKEWARDATFIIDRLFDGRRLPRVIRRIADRIDRKSLGMLGHSLGGAAALEACRNDDRIRACADLDGAPFGQVKSAGVKKPTLVLRSGPVYSDEDLAKKGRTREQWEEMGRQGKLMWASIEPKSPGIAYFNFSVLGTGHMSYSDSPFTMPDTITRFGGKITNFDRAYDIISAYLVDFFDAELKGKKPKLIDLARSPFEEVVRW